MSTEPVSEHMARQGRSGRAAMRSAAAASHRAMVRAGQQQLRRLLEARRGVVLGSVDTVANALFVQAADGSAADLASLPGVKRVHPVRMMHMVLDRAVVLHRVTDAWNRIGADTAGAGVKIAIIDSGIDSGHAGFQDPSLSPPDLTFPRATDAADLAYTNNKIIVARSYVSMLPNRDPDLSARDRFGHGTALAMVAAGVRNAGPLATITGVAPKAYLGNYKVFGTPGFNDGASDDAILKALDDAVADGMDIINLSLGGDLAPRLEDDLDAQAVERAVQAGVIVVVAAGNNGPDLNTISSPATAHSAISVGATTNDRTFAASVEVPGLASFTALVGDMPAPAAPVTGAIADVASLDGSGLACGALPPDSLAGKVALILRGTCTFETKANNVQRAGAVAALIYAAADAPGPISMALGAATLPAEMISYGDGAVIRQSLASQPLTATLRFALGAVPVAANRLTDFSAAGPNVDLGIKPDLTAVGGDIYVATQSFDPRGDMYDPSGYILVDGTSFSTPLVAGAAALLKAARPGLTVDQYRSLLIDTAAAAEDRTGASAAVQQTGGGLLDADAALTSTVAANPVSLSLGAGGGTAALTKTLTLTNLGNNDETFTITVQPRTGGAAPEISNSTVPLAPGASAAVAVTLNLSGAEPGAYEGYLAISGSASGTAAKVPYWYAAASGTPALVSVLDSTAGGRRGRTLRDAILFRLIESSGINAAGTQPEVTVVSGGGSVVGVHSYDSDVPGLFGVDVQLGLNAGINVFRIQAGGAVTEVSISGQ
jgi:subtilisin family serine protease